MIVLWQASYDLIKIGGCYPKSKGHEEYHQPQGHYSRNGHTDTAPLELRRHSPVCEKQAEIKTKQVFSKRKAGTRGGEAGALSHFGSTLFNRPKILNKISFIYLKNEAIIVLVYVQKHNSISDESKEFSDGLVDLKQSENWTWDVQTVVDSIKSKWSVPKQCNTEAVFQPFTAFAFRM